MNFMLFPARMMEVSVIVHDSVRYDVIRTMQNGGFIHITYHQIEELPEAKPSERIDKIVEYEYRISKLLDILNIGRRKKGGFKALLNPEPPERFPWRDIPVDEIFNESRKTLEEVEDEIHKLHDQWEDLLEEEEYIRVQMGNLKLLGSLKFDVSYLGEGPYVYITAGVTKNIEPFYKLQSEGKIKFWLRAFGKKKNRSYVVVAVCHEKYKRDLESAMRFSGFTEFDFSGWSGMPDEVIKKMREKLENIANDKKTTLEKIRKMRAKYYEKLAVLYDALENERAKEEILSRMGKTKYTTVIRGYIPKKRLDNALKDIEKAGKGLAYVKTREAEGEDTPVLLDNPMFLRPFQAFVEMYSTPKYGYLDPTVIIAPIFIIYFGLTLGDAGYGLIMAILGLLLWKKIGKYDWSNRTIGKILFPSGLSAIFFGIIQGSIFGPLNEYNPLTPFIHYKPFMDTMKDPVSLLVIALIVGIGQILLGLIIAAYQHLKHRDYSEFVKSELSWFILFPSGAVLIGKFFGWWTFSPIIITFMGILGIVGLLMLVGIVSAVIWRNKKAVNPLVLFDITGMLGDWLSFSRLLALDLATSGIAFTINIFASIIHTMALGMENTICCTAVLVIGLAMYLKYLKRKDPLKKGIGLFLLVMGAVGVINFNAALFLFIGIFLVVGHIGNAILQSLGSFVHSLRLQYVEFFSKFYEGDGVKFEPFRIYRKYTKKVGGAKK